MLNDGLTAQLDALAPALTPAPTPALQEMESIYHVLNDGLTAQLDALHQERWECEVMERVLQALCVREASRQLGSKRRQRSETSVMREILGE